MPLELARTPEVSLGQFTHALRNGAVADGGRRDHVRIITGPQPYRHAHYAADVFFHADAARGIVTNVYGQRMLRVTDNFLRTLSAALAERADSVLEAIGRAWGESTMRDFVPRVEQEYEVEFEKMGMGMMLESWWWPLRAAGWGTWRCDFRHARSGMVLIELNDSAAVATRGPGEGFVCSLYAGLLAAAFSHIAGRELGALEIQCAARGDASCRFVVAAPSRVAAAQRLRGEGLKADQIVQRLCQEK